MKVRSQDLKPGIKNISDEYNILFRETSARKRTEKKMSIFWILHLAIGVIISIGCMTLFNVNPPLAVAGISCGAFVVMMAISNLFLKR